MMTHHQATVGVVLTLLASAVGGCSLNSRSPIAPLPVHQLDLSSFASRRGEVAVAVGGKWYATNPRQWRHIVIHHSATSSGNAMEFDKMHRNRGWDELGYHFVIDNGNGGSDGRVEVGSRWKNQKHGAHCGGTPNNEYNELGIGICLVGDFSHGEPSAAQLAALKELVFHLTRTYKIPPENVIGHCQAPHAHTACPGWGLQAFVNRTLRGNSSDRLARASK